MPNPEEYFGKPWIDEFTEAFSPHTKPKKKKPPLFEIGGSDDSKDGWKTTLIKPREDVIGVRAVEKREGSDILYKPTYDSWLVEETGEDYDFMTEGELKGLAAKAWEGSSYQERDRREWEKENPSIPYEEHVTALIKSDGARDRPQEEEEEESILPEHKKTGYAVYNYTLEELIELADGDREVIRALKATDDPQRTAMDIGLLNWNK